MYSQQNIKKMKILSIAVFVD